MKATEVIKILLDNKEGIGDCINRNVSRDEGCDTGWATEQIIEFLTRKIIEADNV